MDTYIIGLAAVVMSLGIPMAAMYTFFRVRKLRSEERSPAESACLCNRNSLSRCGRGAREFCS
jgi:hypothetical protein